MNIKSTLTRQLLGLLAIASLFANTVRAEYSYFSDVPKGSDIVVKEVRWPYWYGYYNTWWSQTWISSEGTSGYFYNGLALPNPDEPSPVTKKHVINWSFWPLSHPVNITDTIASIYTSSNTFAMQTIGEGTILGSPGLYTGWQTNVWYRMVLRTWRPLDGTPHLGYAGTWMRDPVGGIWHHMASVQLPFSVIGVSGSMGFQENVAGDQPQRTDYRGSYYHYNGTWHSSTNFHIYVHSPSAIENTGLIESNSAVFYETCKTNGVCKGEFTVGQTSPTLNLTQPEQQPLDPILVTKDKATIAGDQLLVQWEIPPTSSPQFAYQIDIFTNATCTGSVVATAYDIDPEARQKLLTIGQVPTPFARLTIIDLFDQTNTPITLTPTAANLQSANPITGTVNGLNFAYYQSATAHTSDTETNWSVMPDFAALAPVSAGAVNGLDMTPRQRRNGYAFNYNGYLKVDATGIYAFTLNSDSGSKLYLDGQLVVDNDGDHSPRDLSGWIGLQAGFHSLNVQYYLDTQPSLYNGRTYFDRLTLSSQGPGHPLAKVPDSAYFRLPVASEPTVTLSSPGADATVSGANVPLAASVTANGNALNQVQYYLGDTCWTQSTNAPFSLTSFFWASPANALRARLIYNTTNSLDSAVQSFTTTNMTLAPWQFSQIFYHKHPNGARIQDGTYSLIGDGVNLLARPVSGDCTFIAHLAALPGNQPAPDGTTPDYDWQAGIILRGSTNMTPGYPLGCAPRAQGVSTSAPFAAVLGTVGGETYYQNEHMHNGGGGYHSEDLGGQKWFRLQRAGNTFTSSVSADGTSWTTVNTTNLPDFGPAFYAGFFTYAGPSANPNIHWASFDHVTLTGNLENTSTPN